MNFEVPLPSLGADMEKAKFVEWKVSVGDEIHKGDPLAVVETEKAAVEIESYRDGKITELLKQPGDVIQVGVPIATMETDMTATQVIPDRKKISPLAKKKATEAGVDISKLIGTGPEGAIQLKDLEVERTVKSKVEEKPFLSIRDVIARQMTKSKKEIPHYYLKSRIQIDHLMHWIDEQNQQKAPDERLLIPAALLKAVIKVIKLNPNFNGYYIDGAFKEAKDINIGMVVSLPGGGVIVPALLQAQNLTLDQLNQGLKDLVERARTGHLKNREMTEVTVSVSNMGDLGAHEIFGIIFPPQVALIGFGKIRKDAVVEHDAIRSGFIIDVSLSADHRVTDGLAGARLLRQLEQLLNEPDKTLRG